MTVISRNSSLGWLVVPVAALVLAVGFHRAAIERVVAVSDQFTAGLILTPDPTSPTGLAEGRRTLIVPGHNLESYEWIVQAANLRQQGDWRLRQVDYDNAPTGRTVQSPSAVRWWLAGVTPWLGAEGQANPSVAAASLKSEPLLHITLILGVTGLVAWQWGAFPAAMAALVVGLGFPVIGSFQAGAPSTRGLMTLVGTGSLLSFLVGLQAPLRPRFGRIWWIISGIFLGVGIWVAPDRGYPLALLLTAGGMAAGWRQRRSDPARRPAALPWWPWSVAAALTTTALYGVDYHGVAIDWGEARLHQLHPLYAVSLLGLGGLGQGVQRGTGTRRTWFEVGGALALTLSLGATMMATGDPGFLRPALGAGLMSHLPDSTSAGSFADWVNERSSPSAAAGVFLPVALIALAIWRLTQRSLAPATRAPLLTAVVVTVGGLSLAFSNLAWWPLVFAGIATTTALAAAGLTAPRHQLIGGLGVLGAVGIAWFDLAPRMVESNNPELTTADIRSLAERDLAHWLSLRQDEYRSVVLSPPDTTPALYFYGGVRGLGSPYAENRDGFIAAVRIAGATSPDESLALATQREISHIVIPSWDDFLDEYARLGAAQPEHSMMALLHNWSAPRWMRPVQHTLPEDQVFADYDSVIFRAVETQDNASALSRLGEYFAETQQPRFAAAIAVTLQQSFPSDLSGLVAQAQIAVTQGKVPVFQEALAAILPYVEEERDGDLEFDRRVSLANVLMLGREPDYAREQVGYCMDEMDAFLLTTVSPVNLYRFMLLAQSFNEPFPDPELEPFARQLLPDGLRDQL